MEDWSLVVSGYAGCLCLNPTRLSTPKFSIFFTHSNLQTLFYKPEMLFFHWFQTVLGGLQGLCSPITATSGRALAVDSKENKAEVDCIKGSKDGISYSKISSPLIGITSENGGTAHLRQPKKIVETQDGYGGTRRKLANITTLSEEANGTPDLVVEHDIDFRNESHNEDIGEVDENDDDDKDEDYEHLGEVSIGKKLWNFITT